MFLKKMNCKKHSVVAKNATTAKDGKTYHVYYYSLDVIISIGYRIKSALSISFSDNYINII
jgi:hypothetical protein